MRSSVADKKRRIMEGSYQSLPTSENFENMAPNSYRDATRIQIEDERQRKRLNNPFQEKHLVDVSSRSKLQTGALAKMIQATTGVMGMDFHDQYKDLEWTDESGSFNRHNGLPKLDSMPLAFQLKYESIFKYAQVNFEHKRIFNIKILVLPTMDKADSRRAHRYFYACFLGLHASARELKS